MVFVLIKDEERNQYWLDDFISYNLSLGNEWETISVVLLLKLDFEIHSLQTKTPMNEQSFSFASFDYSLRRFLIEKTLTKQAISIIEMMV